MAVLALPPEGVRNTHNLRTEYKRNAIIMFLYAVEYATEFCLVKLVDLLQLSARACSLVGARTGGRGIIAICLDLATLMK